MKNILLPIISIITLTSCIRVQPTSEISDSIRKRIDSLFTEFDNLDSPGYAIGISKNGKTYYKRGYGAANLDYNIPIETTSSFSIASVSKQFTAACIALLIIEKKISLESDAADFIPALRKYTDTIRIKHLIYNTSGITDYPLLKRKSNKSWVTFNYFDIDECISTSLEEDSLKFKPGEKWDYCNVNFMLLTKIVENISRQTFSEYIKVKLFDTLKMNSTFINDDITSVIKKRVTPYNERNKTYLDAYAQQGITLKTEGTYIQHPRNSPHYGGSGVVSTIDDLLKWTSNMETKIIGGQKFYDLIHKTLKFNHTRDNQAFGLYIGKYRDRKTVAWEGGDYGISSQILRFPHEGISIIVLSNLGSGEAAHKANSIADILIDNGVLK